MDVQDERIAGLLRTTQVGDTLRFRIEKSKVGAEVRDRVSPIVEAPADSTESPTLQGFTKDASGMWDLESLTGAKNAQIVEIVIRRAASDL